jgi:hypothetical protein
MRSSASKMTVRFEAQRCTLEQARWLLSVFWISATQ